MDTKHKLKAVDQLPGPKDSVPGARQRVFPSTGKALAPPTIPTNIDRVRHFEGVSNLQGVYTNIETVLNKNEDLLDKLIEKQRAANRQRLE